jgi:hypothetical protein
MAMCAAGPPKAIVPSFKNKLASSPREPLEGLPVFMGGTAFAALSSMPPALSMLIEI